VETIGKGSEKGKFGERVIWTSALYASMKIAQWNTLILKCREEGERWYGVVIEQVKVMKAHYMLYDKSAMKPPWRSNVHWYISKLKLKTTDKNTDI
jgi:hypothetical protein